MLRDALDEVQALTATGQVVRALELARGLDRRALALPYLPLAVESGRALLAPLVRSYEQDEATALAERVYFDALEANLLGDAFHVATSLVYLEGADADFDAGRGWARHASSLLEASGEAGHEGELLLLVRLGTLEERAGDLHTARGHLLQALAIADKNPSLSSMALSTAHNTMSNLLRISGELERAAEYARMAVALAEKYSGDVHPALGPPLNNLAAALVELREFDEAEQALLRSLAVREAAVGPDHHLLALALTNLGSLAKERLQYDVALQHYRRADALLERHAGDEDGARFGALYNMSQILIKQDQVAEAESMLAQAETLVSSLHGPRDRRLAAVDSARAEIAIARGDLDEALVLFEHALAIRESALGSGHKEVAMTLASLMEVYGRRGEHEQAVAAGRRAVVVSERAFPTGHLETLRVRRALGQALVAAAQIDEGLALLTATTEQMQSTGAPDLSVAATEFALAQALWEAEVDRPRARALAQRAHERLVGAGKLAEGELVKKWLAEHADHHE